MLGTGAFLYPGLLSQREMESAGMGEWGHLNVETTSSEWTQDRSTGLQKAPAVNDSALDSYLPRDLGYHLIL